MTLPTKPQRTLKVGSKTSAAPANKTPVNKAPANARAANRAGLHMALLQNGQQAMRSGRFKEAVRAFEAVLKDLPDHMEANYMMAQMATKLGATRNAVDHIRRALKLGTGQHLIHAAMAEACSKHGLAGEALEHIDKALMLEPENVQTKVLKASILLQLGKMQEAHALARSLVLANPSDNDAIIVFANSAKFTGTEPEIALIERAYRDKPRPGSLKALGYAVGKMHNDAKHYDEAFAWFKSAADSYDARNVQGLMTERTRLMREAFSEDVILKKRLTGHPSKKPIFIVGMPRSGTTLTEQILASHPDICGVGELMAMARISMMVSTHDGHAAAYANDVRKTDKKKQHILGENYLNTVYGFDKNSRHYADKMPSNFFYIGLINILFPHAKIIHCTRDAIDNCVSCYTSPLNETHLYAKRLDVLGHYYRSYHALMDYWKDVSPIEIFDMSYEATVENLEGQARALIDHVGLPWNAACLKFNEAKSQISTISKWQVRQPIYTTSIKRWKAYEKHIGPLIEALGDLAVTD